MAQETKDQMQERFEAEIAALKGQLSGRDEKLGALDKETGLLQQQVDQRDQELSSKNVLLDQQKTRIGELEEQLQPVDTENGPATDELQYDGPESEWRDVEGTVDQLGKLQALSIGRMDRPGVLLRYVTANNTVLSCAPYRDAKMVAGTYESAVSLSYAG